jgi:hypothetical protein
MYQGRIMAKVVLKGIDWLELNVSFDTEVGRNGFLQDVERFHQMGFKLRTEYLDKKWTKVPHKRNARGRFELVSAEGIYLDMASYQDAGNGYLLRISLLKPLDRSLKCLLWESPFATMKEILKLFSNKYGAVSYSIARSDIFCHFTGFQLKSADSKRFLGLPRGPWEHDTAFTGFSFKHKRAKVKRVEAVIYSLAQRKTDIPNSFDPADYYTTQSDVNAAWNLEFRLYKTFLNERKIFTLEQLEANLPSLWRQLTSKKLRLIIKSKDRNKARWKTNRHWKSLQNAFGNDFIELKRTKRPAKRQVPKEIIKRIETALLGLAVSLDLWNKPLSERVKEIFGCFDINRFTDEEMMKYRYERT